MKIFTDLQKVRDLIHSAEGSIKRDFKVQADGKTWHEYALEDIQRARGLIDGVFAQTIDAIMEKQSTEI